MTDSTRAEALIVGSEGQDAQFLASAINRRGLNVLKLSKSGLSLNDRKMLDIQKVDQKVLEQKIEHSAVNQIYFTAANSFPAGKRNTQYDSNFNEKNFAIEKLLEDCLESAQNSGRKIKFVYFSSALRFGDLQSTLDENSITSPVEPYGIHKIKCESIVQTFAESNSNLEYVIPILFNHTSHLSKPNFLLKKITSAIRNNDAPWLRQQLLIEEENPTYIDIGCAREYMETLVVLAQSKEQGLFVFSTGVTIPISFFFQAGLKIIEGINDYESPHTTKAPYTADYGKLRAALKLPSGHFSYGFDILESILKMEQLSEAF